MKKNIRLAIVGSMLTSISVQAYQFEFGAEKGYENYEYERVGSNSSEMEESSSRVYGTIYLKDVSAGDGPLAEGSFLNKVGHVRLAYQYATELYYRDEYDSSIKSLDARVVLNKIIIAGAVQSGVDEFWGGELDTLASRVGAGFYIGERSSIMLFLETIEREAFDVTFSETDSINVGLKYHIPFGQSIRSMSVGGGVGLSSTEGSNGNMDEVAFELDLFATYYPTRQLGITAELDTIGIAGDGDNYYSDEYSEVRQEFRLKAEYFATEHFAVYGGAGFSFAEIDAFGDDAEETGFEMQAGIKIRF